MHAVRYASAPTRPPTLESELSPLAREMTSAARRAAFTAKEKQRLKELKETKQRENASSQTPTKRGPARDTTISATTLLDLCKTINVRATVQQTTRRNNLANKENIPVGGLKSRATIGISGVRVRVRNRPVIPEDLRR